MPYRAGSHYGGADDVAYSDTTAGGESYKAEFLLYTNISQADS